MRALAPLVLAAGFALAGCLAPALEPASVEAAGLPGAGIDASKLTTAQFSPLPKTIEGIAASLDGIRLHAEIYLPDGPGPWPTILVMSPYHFLDRAFTADADADLEGSLREHYVPRGYAVVTVDVRGTGNSEGCMDMMGAKEQQDAADAVEWIASQPWSDGKVGMFGISYVGTTPSEAAIMAAPHLVTFVPVAGVTNQWRNTFQNGVPYAGRSYPLTYEVLVGAPPPLDVARGPAWAANVAAAACDQEQAAAAMAPGTYEMGVYDAYWAERNFTVKAKDVKAAIFYNQGFTDRAVNPMEIVHWFNEIDAPKKAFLGQWAHQFPAREDWDTTLHAWFDYWLKGIENGVMDTPVVEIVTNTDEIRVAAEWPPRDATPLPLWLAPGELSPAAPADASESYRAWNGASVVDSAAWIGPEPATDGTENGLAFVAAPLDADVLMAGSATMRLVASVDAPNTYFLASLYDVDGDTWTEITEGWFNAHLREGFDRSSPLTPGEAYAFTFRFEPREWVFEKGHAIGLRIKGHDARVAPFDEFTTVNTLQYGVEGSWLEIPTLPDAVLHARPQGV